MTNPVVEGFNALLKERDELQTRITEEAKDVFAIGAKEIFEKYGNLVGLFGWQQYTPYFNDGEPCEFSKHEVFIYTPEEVEEGDINYWGSEGVFGYSGNEETVYKNKETGELSNWGPSYQETRAGIDRFEVVPNPDYQPAYDEAKKAVEDLCNLIDEDTALSLFGDHTTVIVKPEGVETDHCEHE